MKLKGKKKKKQLCLKLNLDNTFDEVALPRENAQIKDGTNNVTMQPACIFVERKKPRFRARRRIILFVEGTARALKFKNVEIDPKDPAKGQKPQLDDPQPFWTQGDAAQFVEKKIAESLEKRKPMTWGQVIILFVMMAVNLGIMLWIASGLRLF